MSEEKMYSYMIKSEEYIRRATAAGFIPPPKIPSPPDGMDVCEWDEDAAFKSVGIEAGTQFFSYMYNILTVIPWSDGKIVHSDWDLCLSGPKYIEPLFYRGEYEMWYKPPAEYTK